jgi:hypothetical protein
MIDEADARIAVALLKGVERQAKATADELARVVELMAAASEAVERGRRRSERKGAERRAGGLTAPANRGERHE